jgi:alanine-glyoxylate transaminase/serine-glyoxylate transaminase/serine-pyruvate transaminase
MIPGPVDVEEEILEALAQPVLPHYGKAWLEIYHETVAGLKQVFGTREEMIMMAGPGTAGLEAALGSLMRTGEKVVVTHNGFFGRRLGTVAENYGLQVRHLEAPLGQPIDPDALRQVLAHEPDVQAVTVVHLETSTGVLNPLRDLAAVANEFGVPIIADAVSSLGGVPLPVDEWGIDVCVTVVNKCLACPPGLAPLSVGQRAWEQIDRKGGRAHGWYLNLRVWKDYAVNWGDWHPYPTTLPTNLILALRASLRRILDQGLEAHYERYVRAARVVSDGLGAMGFRLFTDETCTSPLITAVNGLPGMDVEDYRRYLLEEQGIMISGGLDDLRGKIFRVGHIGKAASAEYVEAFLAGTEAYLRLQGRAVPVRETVTWE